MNKQLLLQTIRTIKKNKNITIEKIVTQEKCTYADAYDIMSYLIKEKIIAEKKDGIFSAVVSMEEIDLLSKAHGDCLKEFVDDEIKAKINIIDRLSLLIMAVVGKGVGLTAEEIQSKINNKYGDIKPTLQMLVNSQFVILYKEKYYRAVTADVFSEIAHLYNEKMFSEKTTSEPSIKQSRRKKEPIKIISEDDDGLEFVEEKDDKEDDIEEKGIASKTGHCGESDIQDYYAANGLSNIMSQIKNVKDNGQEEQATDFKGSKLSKCKLSNEKGEGFFLDFSIIDTPKELIERAFTQNKKKFFDVFISKNDKCEDVNNFDKNKSSIYIATKGIKIPLVWGKCIAGQLGSEIEALRNKKIVYFVATIKLH